MGYEIIIQCVDTLCLLTSDNTLVLISIILFTFLRVELNNAFKSTRKIKTAWVQRVFYGICIVLTSLLVLLPLSRVFNIPENILQLPISILAGGIGVIVGIIFLIYGTKTMMLVSQIQKESRKFTRRRRTFSR